MENLCEECGCYYGVDEKHNCSIPKLMEDDAKKFLSWICGELEQNWPKVYQRCVASEPAMLQWWEWYQREERIVEKLLLEK
jgi:hypothetical protein